MAAESTPPQEPDASADATRLDLPLRGSRLAHRPRTSEVRPDPGRRLSYSIVPRPGPRRPEAGSQRARRPRLGRAWLAAAAGGAALLAWFVWSRPRLEVAPPSLAFGEQRVGTRAEPRTVRLGNVGRRTLRLAAVEPGSSQAGEFAVVADSCSGRALPYGASCSVALVFAPSAAGDRLGELTVVGNAGRERIPLAGIGTAPQLVVAPERLEFGKQLVGQAGPEQVLTLRNEGTAPLALGRLALTGPGAATFRTAADGCSGRSLDPAASCTARWVFRPDRPGEATAALEVASDAETLPAVTLAGIGIAPGLLVTPERLDFGALRVGSASEARSVLFENTGSAPLALTGLEVAGAGREAFEIVEQDCSAGLEPGDNCSAAVRFRPSTEGQAVAALRPRATGLVRRPEVALVGRGTARRLAVRPLRLEFGRVETGDRSRLSVAVESVGGEPVALGRIAVGGGSAGEFRAGGSCQPGLSLAGGRSCTIDVDFTPSGVGARSAALRVEHDGLGGPLSVELAGGGVVAPVAAIAVEPPRLDFGLWQVGERSAIASVRVGSTGTTRLQIGDIRLAGPEAGDFQLVPASCSGIPYVAPGSDCVVGVRFVPRGRGPRRAELWIRHDAPGGATAVPLAGEGG